MLGRLPWFALLRRSFAFFFFMCFDMSRQVNGVPNRCHPRADRRTGAYYGNAQHLRPSGCSHAAEDELSIAKARGQEQCDVGPVRQRAREPEPPPFHSRPEISESRRQLIDHDGDVAIGGDVNDGAHGPTPRPLAERGFRSRGWLCRCMATAMQDPWSIAPRVRRGRWGMATDVQRPRAKDGIVRLCVATVTQLPGSK